MKPKHIIISRTDSIGDVILTLPLLGLLKKQFQGIKITFLGQIYTKPVIMACQHVDAFLDWNEISNQPHKARIEIIKNLNADTILHVFPVLEIARLASQADIKQRIGSSGRYYHYLYCNRIIKLSRKNSPFHEAQLNIMLAEKLFCKSKVSGPLVELQQLYGLQITEPVAEEFSSLIDAGRLNIILHPKSKGSAREWGSDNFAVLSALLPPEKFKIFITGTRAEGDVLRNEGFFDKAGNLVDLTGKMNLSELISFIAACDGLIAASTGPLHLAAALGKIALGIYPPIKPMHPGRWAPMGIHADFLVADKICSDCRKSGNCECMRSIKPQQVKQKLEKMVQSYSQYT